MMNGKTLRAINLVIIAIVLVLAISGWSARTATSSSPGQITVTGDAEIRVVPDEVILSLGVETWDKNLQKATNENDRIVAAVLALARKHDIEPQHVQTDYVSIEPRYRNGYYEASDFIGFFVHKTVVITLRDLTRFEDVLKDALEAGVNYVHGVEFRTMELRKYRDQARALAIKAAEEKAIALAGELDQTVGVPTHIQEVQTSWYSGYGSWWGSRWNNAMAQNVIQEISSDSWTGDGSVAPGQIKVSTRVSVDFELTR